MKTNNFVYKYKDKEINVYVKRGRQRNIYYRYKEDGFYVSAPYLASAALIKKGLDQYAERLMGKYEVRNNNYSFGENYVFLLGEKVEISSLNVQNDQELLGFLKKTALSVITELVRKNEQIMGITIPYKIAIRKTVNQFGSNSMKTHKLSFQLNLVHYSKEIIESVVVHELAHEFQRNHQKKFYDIVYKYCPSYDILQRKLKKGIHK